MIKKQLKGIDYTFFRKPDFIYMKEDPYTTDEDKYTVVFAYAGRDFVSSFQTEFEAEAELNNLIELFEAL